MSFFATEFPASTTFGRPQFEAGVIAWLRGIRYSRVFENANDRELDADAVNLSAEGGEALAMLRHTDGQANVTGVRYDLPDAHGRTWRSEAVLRESGNPAGRSVLRVCVQCIASGAVAQLDPPKRPHLIRALLDDGHGGRDRELVVQPTVHLPDDSETGQLLGAAIAEGTATLFLPVVYVSATGREQWSVPRADLDRLATDLGGVAHVVLEPSRDMSFRLRDLTEGRNAYGGTLGLALPGRGIVRRLFIGWALPDARALLEATRAAATELRRDMGKQGSWDWLDLQEAILRGQRAQARNRVTATDSETMWQKELKEAKELSSQQLAAKDERIADLKASLARAKQTRSAADTSTGIAVDLPVLGPEIYHGEFVDRLRSAMADVVQQGTDKGWDRRTLSLFEGALAATPASPALAKLKVDLRQATMDAGKVARAVPDVLEGLGFVRKSDNKHIRMEAGPSLIGLDTITVPKTPGDHRSGNNLRAQIEGVLGTKRLK